MIIRKQKAIVKLLILITGFVIQPISADEKAFWIDVRTTKEFISGHVDDSINIPYDKIKDNLHLLPHNKNAQINVYCRSGRRSNIAKILLLGLGYLNVVDHGGLDNVASKF